MEPNKVLYNPLEVARILGEPKDPTKPLTDLVSLVCQTDTADPDEYVYYFDSLVETNTLYTITSNGNVTSSSVSADTPTAFTFIDVATPEYYVKLTELASAKEATLARKLRTINNSLNLYENKYIIALAAAAASGAGNTLTLTSATMRFNYANVIDMLQSIIDYGDNYVLLVGSTIDTDIKKWDWNDNKYHSMLEAFNDLGIKKIRMGAGDYALDSQAATRPLTSNLAYMIATDTVMGKPFLFVRKKLNDIDLLGAAIKQNGEKPERLVFVSPNPISASGGTTRYLAVGITGFEEIVAACVCQEAVAKFTRA
jgi:hypothetical protein